MQSLPDEKLAGNGNGPAQGAGFNAEEQNEAIAGETSGDGNGQPLSTQGSDEVHEENLGGTTNLCLEQLKKEGDAGLSQPNT